ncbi:hypothetical protein LIA77_11998 [Sarocladium implicatum]|nr:hypothetical protein LIA77_11998 [Sarocladium implicatum]
MCDRRPINPNEPAICGVSLYSIAKGGRTKNRLWICDNLTGRAIWALVSRNTAADFVYWHDGLGPWTERLDRTLVLITDEILPLCGIDFAALGRYRIVMMRYICKLAITVSCLSVEKVSTAVLEEWRIRPKLAKEWLEAGLADLASRDIRVPRIEDKYLIRSPDRGDAEQTPSEISTAAPTIVPEAQLNEEQRGWIMDYLRKRNDPGQERPIDDPDERYRHAKASHDEPLIFATSYILRQEMYTQYHVLDKLYEKTSLQLARLERMVGDAGAASCGDDAGDSAGAGIGADDVSFRMELVVNTLRELERELNLTRDRYVRFGGKYDSD